MADFRGGVGFIAKPKKKKKKKGGNGKKKTKAALLQSKGKRIRDKATAWS